jgi:NAD(P)H-hydrate epimerase
MENAGAAVAAEAAAFLSAKGVPVAGARVVVCCGRGANGGDGLVVARKLKEAGALPEVFICPPKADSSGYPPLVREALKAAEAAGVRVLKAGEGGALNYALKNAALAVDALLGTGSTGKPAGQVHHMIQELTRAKKPVIAVDIPSGLHPDTGYHSGAFVTAELTLALGLPKRGLVAPHARRQVGELKVLDIGYPPELLKAARP